MNVLIVEDELMARRALAATLKRLYPEMTIVGETGSVADTVEWLDNPDHKADLIFMDVELSDGNSFEIFRRTKVNAQVIMTTAYDNYAVKAFSVEATHYLVKPVSRLDLEEAVDRALRTFSPVQTLQLPLHSENGSVVKINIDDILYIESVGYRRMIHTRTTVYEEKRTTLSRLMEDLERLSPGKFILPYRGYIVNLDAIKTVSSNRIVLENDDFVLIKRGDFRKIRDLFLERVFPRE